jgi:hypothetical protein
LPPEREEVVARLDPLAAQQVLPVAGDHVLDRWGAGPADSRERTLLRQHYVDGLGIDRLAPLHQVHRSTCARWIESARGKALRGVRNHLRARLGLDDAELEAAIAMVRSQLDLSLSRHLASGSDPAVTPTPHRP